MPEINVCLMEADQALEAACLVRRVFDACVAPLFEEQGREEFYRFIEPEALRQRVSGGASHVVLASLGSDVVGMLELRLPDHISLFFVEPAEQRHGIGHRLMTEMLALVRGLDAVPDAITVHASPNAVAAYQRFGFQVTGDEQLINGIRFVPMSRLARFLPGR